MDEPRKRSYSFVKETTELKKLIAEHPDYDIVVEAGENANIGDSFWMLCTDIRFGVGQVLDCEGPNDEKCYTDEDDLQEDVEDALADQTDPNMPDVDFKKLVDEWMEKYRPFWKDVIFIYADN